MMARKIQMILLRALDIFWTNAQKNTNPRFGTVIIGGPTSIRHARPSQAAPTGRKRSLPPMQQGINHPLLQCVD